MISLTIEHALSNLTPIVLRDSWKKYGKTKTERTVFSTLWKIDFYYSKRVQIPLNRIEYIQIAITNWHELFWRGFDVRKVNLIKKDFNFYSAHDVGWRRMGFITDLYFDTCRSMTDDAPANVEVSSYIIQSDISKGEVIKNLNCPRSYDRSLVIK